MKKPLIESEIFSQFLSSRRSTRDFDNTEVPKELIEQILKDALTAPSWSNTRPFKIAIASGKVRDEISAEFQSRWEKLSEFRNGNIFNKAKIIFHRKSLPNSNWISIKPYVKELSPRANKVGKELYSWIGIKRGDRKARDEQWNRNYQFFGAPVEMFIFVHKSLDIFAASDAGLMLSNLILSAHARGLGTCLQGAVAIWDDAVREKFEVSKDYRLLCGLALGYPSNSKINSFQAERINPAEILALAKT